MLPRNDRLGIDLFHYFIRLDTYGRATEEQLSSKGNALRWNEFAVSRYVKQIHWEGVVASLMRRVTSIEYADLAGIFN